MPQLALTIVKPSESPTAYQRLGLVASKQDVFCSHHVFKSEVGSSIKDTSILCCVKSFLTKSFRGMTYSRRRHKFLRVLAHFTF